MPVLNEDSEHRASLPLTAQEYRQSAHQSMQNQSMNMYGNRNGGGNGGGNGNANATNNLYDFRHLSPEQQQAVAAEVHHKQMLAMNMAMNMNMNMNMNMGDSNTSYVRRIALTVKAFSPLSCRLPCPGCQRLEHLVQHGYHPYQRVVL